MYLTRAAGIETEIWIGQYLKTFGMYLTRAAGIETDFEYLFAFYFWKMYLTRAAGIETLHSDSHNKPLSGVPYITINTVRIEI